MTTPVIIVTGASRGIGRAIVDYLLAHASAPIVLGTARTEEPLAEIAAEHSNFHFVVGDAADGDVNDELVKLAVSMYGRLDGVVLNAGVLEPVTKLADSSAKDWARLYDINVFAVVDLLSKSIKHLRKDGKVIFVSSGAATGHYVSWGGYGSSKASLNHIAATLAEEEPSIFSISLAPGVVQTKMQENIRTLREFGLVWFIRGSNTDGQSMEAKQHQKFLDLHETGTLLDPSVPAKVIGNMILRGGSKDLSGKFFRFNDDVLKSYASY